MAPKGKQLTLATNTISGIVQLTSSNSAVVYPKTDIDSLMSAINGNIGTLQTKTQNITAGTNLNTITQPTSFTAETTFNGVGSGTYRAGTIPVGGNNVSFGFTGLVYPGAFTFNLGDTNTYINYTYSATVKLITGNGFVITSQNNAVGASLRVLPPNTTTKNIFEVTDYSGNNPFLTVGNTGIVNTYNGLKLSSWTVAQLTTIGANTGAPIGTIIWVTNAIKPSESSGSGTGVMAVKNTTGTTLSTWVRIPDYATIST